MDESDPQRTLEQLLRIHPHDDALRLVYADHLLEQGDLLGELISLDARGTDPARVSALEARFFGRMLGALAGHVSECRFRLGALREAADLGTAQVSLEEWRSLSAVRTSRAALVAAHAGTLREARLDGWEAFAALCERQDPLLLEKIWPLQLGELPQSPALPSESALRHLKQLALAAPASSDALMPLARKILESDLPIEVLRVQTARLPTREDLDALREHPTLRRFEWIGGLWQREEGPQYATLPALPERDPQKSRKSEPPALTLHHQPLRGLDPQLWLAHDDKMSLSLVWLPDRYDRSAEEIPDVEGIEPGQPMPLADSAIVARRFAPGAPLGPAPWSEETRSAVLALVRRVNAQLAPNQQLAEGSLERIVRRDGGELVLLAPPLVWKRPGAHPEAESALGSHVTAAQPWAALTCAGSVRSLNEDAWRVHPSGVWVVADGMGGQGSGEVAARRAVDLWRQPGDSRALAAAIRAAIAEIGGGLGAAAARVALSGARASVAWVGNVRVYLLRDGTLSQVTRDHTLLEHASAIGKLDLTQGRHHPSANILLRSFTSRDEEEPDEIDLTLREGDLLLMLSDGVWQALDDPTLCALVARERSLEGIVSALVSEADRCDGSDNTTALVIRFEGARG